ncbi:uncharacterized protein [Battus philenor]|uniref:uncharacterized protein n=1 Tax=Battus philenor TaxID=42288 RepID=UPI0035CFF23F
MVFDNYTTYKTEFRGGDIKPPVKTLYKGKKRSTKNAEFHGRYIHTMMYWTKDPAPFHIMIDRKQIVRTNPHEIQAVYEKPPDLELDEVRRTRPRLIMTPAVSMDDVEDSQRFILLKNNYTSQMKYEFKDSGDLSKLKAPLRGKYAPASPIVFEKYKQPSVSPEWRMESVSWDRRQLRSCCDATKVFWLHYRSK